VPILRGVSLRGSTHRQGNLRGLIALAVLSCALLALSATAVAASISGHVTEAGAPDHPLAARILVVKLEGGVAKSFAGFAETTPSTGAYTVENLPAGEYKVEFGGSSSYFVQYYDEKPTIEEAEALILGAAEAKTEVDAALIRGGSIAGKVTVAGTGEPAGAVSVCAFDAAGVLRACDETGIDGTYLVGPLETDDYRLQFSPFDEDSLLPEYYADRATLEEATPVHVVTGEAVTSKDAALSPTPQPLPPPSTPPVFSTPPLPLEFIQTEPVVKRHRLHCKKGFRKRKVKGKVRCVKVHKKRQHHRAAR
jgi:hypothetical protein